MSVHKYSWHRCVHVFKTTERMHIFQGLLSTHGNPHTLALSEVNVFVGRCCDSDFKYLIVHLDLPTSYRMWSGSTKLYTPVIT